MDRADIDVILEARKILWGKDEKLSTQEDFTKLWNTVNAEIREKLLEGKASQLTNVGTFSVSKWQHGEKIVQSSPVFALSGRLLHKFGVREHRKWGPVAAPRLLTAASVSGASAQGLRGAAACLAAIQAALRGCVATGYASLVFPGLGTLLVVRGVARMTFEKDFLEEFQRRERQNRRKQPSLPPPPRPTPPQPPPQAVTSPPPSPPSPPPQPPAKRRHLFMGPPPSRHNTQSTCTPQRGPSPNGQPPSDPQRWENRQARSSPKQQKHLRAIASSRRTAEPRATCNLTTCSRHSRHASIKEPQSLPELPSIKQRRTEMEIAEFYRRQERAKVDKEGVMRLYQMECEMRLAKLMREKAAKERRRRMRLRRAAQAQGDTLSTSRDYVNEGDYVNKAVERRSAVSGIKLGPVGFYPASMWPS